MSAAAGDERSRLLRALALSRRFHLLLAYVESPRAADQLVRALAEELPRVRKAPVELVRLDPYEGRETDAPLEDGELADGVLIPLLSPTAERRAHGVVHVVDASRATPADTEAWGRLFALWNEKRNALQQLGGEVLVVLPEPLQRLFATAAPDVWSIRSGEYAVGEEAAQLEAMVSRGAQAAERREALGWYRALPPLALFGGDLLVRPWLEDVVVGGDVESLATKTVFQDEHVYGLPAEHSRLRSAERALGQRRFADAARLLDRLVETDLSTESQQRALTARLVVLAAQDHADKALELHHSHSLPARSPEWLRSQLFQAEAYVHWCAGHLGAAEALDASRSLTRIEDQESRMLRSAERGEIAPAKWINFLSITDILHSPEALINRTLRADRVFLLGGFLTATTVLRIPPTFSAANEGFGEDIAAALRAVMLTALAELARGNSSRAALLLSSGLDKVKRIEEPEMAARVSALHAYAFGLLEENPKYAVASFARARAHIAAWSVTGLDRRSLHRASLAIDLAHATLDPIPTDRIAVARELVERAIALLGDTAEDFITRVLAVETRRELARRLADVSNDDATAEAHRALDLARPLAGRGVPAWDAIFAATEREALTRSMG
jgi:hypothetical protein